MSFYFWLGPKCLNSLSRPWQILFSRARLGTCASAASLLTRCQHTRDKLISTEQCFVQKNHLANKKQSTNLFFCRRSKISKWEFKESRIIPLARPMRLFPLLMLHHFQPPLLLRSCTDSASHGYSHYAPRTCVTEDGCCVATRKAWIPLICRLQPLRKFLYKRLIINRPTNYKENKEEIIVVKEINVMNLVLNYVSWTMAQSLTCSWKVILKNALQNTENREENESGSL